MITKHAKKNAPLTNAAGAVLLAAALLAAAMLAGAEPARAGAAATKCQAGKNAAGGTYFNCLAKAEKGFVTKGDAAKYDAAVIKCAAKLQATWGKLEGTATAAGDPCPAEGDVVGVQDLLDGCAGGVSESASGGTPPPSPLVCEAALEACDDDLATSTGNFATCASNLVTAESELSTCEGELATCEASSGGVVQTGQTTSYGAGSDGAEQRGTARSFTDNGDGTITDNVTGLMWEKKSDDGSIHDKDNVYTWGMTSAPYTMDGTMVATFLADLNSGGGFAGYTDWRIPNVSESQTLVNFEVPYPGPSVFPSFDDSCTGGCSVTTCSCTRSDLHWSSTTDRDAGDHAWGVYFRAGYTDSFNKTDYNSVRAVRGGS